jgi:surfactin synthase thioesterase subunit
MRKIKLFCFPYAGGSASVFSSWEDRLDSNIIVHPVELAGRGRRIVEKPYQSVPEAALDVIRRIKHQLFDSPFAFFGHSMGGAISYELTRQLRKKRYPMPSHIFLSGRSVPHILRNDVPAYHTLPEGEFREKVLDLGGTPRELFDHPELLEILIPLLRADFRISRLFMEDFGPKENIEPLDCDITVLNGTEEDLLPEQINEWKLHTNQNCTFHMFEGDHFFINDEETQEKIFKIINATLKAAVSSKTAAFV